MGQPDLDVFQVIGDPSRRRMLELLSAEKMTINHLAGNFEMSRPAVSKHVKILETAGFIAIEDVGRERYCSLKREGFDALRKWIDYFDRFWEEKLDRLGMVLKEKGKKK